MQSTNEIDVQLPSPELFPHLALPDAERRPTSREWYINNGHTEQDYEESMEEVRSMPRTGETPPEFHELKTCDFCGSHNDGEMGNRVAERPTTLMTNSHEPEYLCAYCFSQVVAQKASLDLNDALAVVMLNDHADWWEVAKLLDRDEEEIREHTKLIVEMYTQAQEKFRRNKPLDDHEAGLLEMFDYLDQLLFHKGE